MENIDPLLKKCRVLILLILAISSISTAVIVLDLQSKPRTLKTPVESSKKILLGVGSLITAVLSLIALLIFQPIKRRILDHQINLVRRVVGLDEQSIIDVLKEEGGCTTQKMLWRKTGMSRVKIHRNVQRLAEKNIVTVKPVGRTNEIALTEWLKPKNIRIKPDLRDIDSMRM
jgi:uncharacterized membrane protein